MSEPTDIRTPQYHILIGQIVTLDDGSKAFRFKQKGHQQYEIVTIDQLLSLIYGIPSPEPPETTKEKAS